jgi:hypothetical protein
MTLPITAHAGGDNIVGRVNSALALRRQVFRGALQLHRLAD